VCVAACSRVLQCVAMCCVVLQTHMRHYGREEIRRVNVCVAECCRVLQCVAVCCSVLCCVANTHDTIWARKNKCQQEGR